MEEYDFEFFGKKKPSLLKRIFYQTLRYVLVAGFLYVTYLGFTMRNIGVTQTPPIEQSAAPESRDPAPAKQSAAPESRDPAPPARPTPAPPPVQTGTGQK